MNLARLVRRAVVVVLLFSLAPSTQVLADQMYRVVDLGAAAGVVGDSYAYGINNRGEVAFRALGLGSFVYSGGQVRDVTAEAGAVRGIDDSGRAIGGTDMSVSRSGLTVGVGALGIYIRDGSTSTDISVPYAPTPYGINDRGQVVGVTHDIHGARYPFLYSNGKATDLSNGFGGEAYAINDRGDVVGAFDRGPIGGFLYHDGHIIDLGGLGGRGAVPYGINDLGQIVGTSKTGQGAIHAFLYQDGVMRDLNDLIKFSPTLVLTDAIGINNKGQIAAQGLLNGEIHAFLISTVSASDHDVNHLI